MPLSGAAWWAVELVLAHMAAVPLRPSQLLSYHMCSRTSTTPTQPLSHPHLAVADASVRARQPTQPQQQLLGLRGIAAAGPSSCRCGLWQLVQLQAHGSEVNGGAGGVSERSAKSQLRPVIQQAKGDDEMIKRDTKQWEDSLAGDVSNNPQLELLWSRITLAAI
jgi:hypothetical protein